ncbi:LacI family DNA-binding transcriptional regulator [Leeuwenhoekiella sp. W20_SRS_FM14]|uniref:LacI family DNA-binding transcriptional regulator n=1 Tax=Leeuwenhoekiella sp. W20_SRS_FM14 TaxID=3240270 RepID=UPI003F9D3E18
MKRISIKDVAKEAGVSIASVSYVLNDRAEGRIGEDTIRRVQKAVADLNYRPNKIAKSLKTQRTFTLGLIVADISNPYFSELARIIEDEARKIDCTLIIGSCDEDKKKFESLIDTFRERQVDGLIMAPVENSGAYLKRLQKSKIPFVLIDRNMPGVDAPSVQINNYEVSYTATEHLLEQGRRNICFVNYTSKLESLIERERGFIASIEKNKEADFKILGIDKDHIDRDIKLGIESILIAESKVDALFFSSNRLAISGLKQLRKLKIPVPEKFAVLAFDETEAYELFNVPISIIRQPLKEIGKLAIATVDNQIRNIETLKVATVLKAELIIKESSLG